MTMAKAEPHRTAQAIFFFPRRAGGGMAIVSGRRARLVSVLAFAPGHSVHLKDRMAGVEKRRAQNTLVMPGVSGRSGHIKGVLGIASGHNGRTPRFLAFSRFGGGQI
jgi:hypothetical protein